MKELRRYNFDGLAIVSTVATTAFVPGALASSAEVSLSVATCLDVQLQHGYHASITCLDISSRAFDITLLASLIHAQHC